MTGTETGSNNLNLYSAHVHIISQSHFVIFDKVIYQWLAKMSYKDVWTIVYMKWHTENNNLTINIETKQKGEFYLWERQPRPNIMCATNVIFNFLIDTFFKSKNK